MKDLLKKIASLHIKVWIWSVVIVCVATVVLLLFVAEDSDGNKLCQVVAKNWSYRLKGVPSSVREKSVIDVVSEWIVEDNSSLYSISPELDDLFYWTMNKGEDEFGYIIAPTEEEMRNVVRGIIRDTPSNEQIEAAANYRRAMRRIVEITNVEKIKTGKITTYLVVYNFALKENGQQLMKALVEFTMVKGVDDFEYELIMTGTSEFEIQKELQTYTNEIKKEGL